MVQFEATQSIELGVKEQPIAIQHYLRQPQRLVKVLVEANRFEQLGSEIFRLKMRPMSFLMLHIQPVVDMRVWYGAKDCVLLQSVGCQIQGSDYIAQRFNLDLEGFLRPKCNDGQTILRGSVHLRVDVELPPALALTPLPLVETAGNSLLRGVLQTMKQRLRWRLLSDYETWCLAAQVSTTDFGVPTVQPET